MTRIIDEIIVHCSATRPGWMAERPLAEQVAEIRRWHVEEHGWRDIGYHWIIGRDGTVAPGRPENVQGAHCAGRNAHSIGVCLVGGHSGSENDTFSDHFTPAQETALRGLIERLGSRFGTLKVSGHNQYAAKACPCFRVPEWHRAKPARTSPVQSTTLQATVTSAVATAGGVFAALGRLEPVTQAIVALCGACALVGLGWIARERLRKWARGDR